MSSEVKSFLSQDITDEEMTEHFGMRAERILKKIGSNTIMTEPMIL